MSFHSHRFYEPNVDDNPRMINQSGLFTVSKNEGSLETWVKTHFKEFHNIDWILMKINISANQHDRFDILKWLHRKNINYSTLFPDIYGAAHYAITQFSVPNY